MSNVDRSSVEVQPQGSFKADTFGKKAVVVAAGLLLVVNRVIRLAAFIPNVIGTVIGNAMNDSSKTTLANRCSFGTAWTSVRKQDIQVAKLAKQYLNIMNPFSSRGCIFSGREFVSIMTGGGVVVQKSDVMDYRGTELVKLLDKENLEIPPE